MRCFRVLLVVDIALTGIWACDELPILGPESLQKINLPLGRSWVYLDSVVISGTDTTVFVREVMVTAAKRDSLSPELRNLLRLEIVAQDGDSLSRASIWYRHDDAGLWEIAFQNEETVFAFPRIACDTNDETLPIVPALFIPANQLKQQAAAANQIILRSEPRLVVKYPLRTGVEWTAFNNPFRRTLRCTKYSLLKVPAGEFMTFKLEGRGELDPAADFVMYDYFCSEGLIRRELHWRDVEAYTVSGHVRHDRFNVDETIVLTGIVN